MAVIVEALRLRAWTWLWSLKHHGSWPGYDCGRWDSRLLTWTYLCLFTSCLVTRLMTWTWLWSLKHHDWWLGYHYGGHWVQLMTWTWLWSLNHHDWWLGYHYGGHWVQLMTWTWLWLLKHHDWWLGYHYGGHWVQLMAWTWPCSHLGCVESGGGGILTEEVSSKLSIHSLKGSVTPHVFCTFPPLMSSHPDVTNEVDWAFRSSCLLTLTCSRSSTATLKFGVQRNTTLLNIFSKRFGKP